jgi:iron(III) transport system ATP-binding protein
LAVSDVPEHREPAFRVADVAKAFAGTQAVDGASLHVDSGEIVALLGPSGSGKTTLLRLVAGFETPDAGSVWVGGRLVADADTWVEPEDRRIGMVFQQGALFPHLTVAKNVGFGASRAQYTRVRECLDLVGLADRADAYPHELSGGERQRIALARALAPEPAVVLLDEPFAALDATLREALRQEVAEILRAAGASALLVTHDQAEALSLADRVAVMREGGIEQVGSPEEIYDAPATRWVASFVGETEAVPGSVAAGVVACELGRFGGQRSADGEVEVVFRPESVAIGLTAPHEDAGRAVVQARRFYGHDQLVELRLASGTTIHSRRLGFPAWHPGDHVRVWIEGPVTTIAPAPVSV